MRVSVIKSDKIIDFILPPQVHGNYWITDKTKNGKERNFINIVENNGKWQMFSNYEISIYENGIIKQSVDLELGKFYLVKIDREEDCYVYCTDVYNNKTVQLSIKNDAEFIIGSNLTFKIKYVIFLFEGK